MAQLTCKKLCWALWSLTSIMTHYWVKQDIQLNVGGELNLLNCEKWRLFIWPGDVSGKKEVVIFWWKLKVLFFLFGISLYKRKDNTYHIFCCWCQMLSVSQTLQYFGCIIGLTCKHGPTINTIMRNKRRYNPSHIKYEFRGDIFFFFAKS